VERKNAQSYLEDSHIKKIALAYEKYETVPNFAKVVTIKDIAYNNFSLSIPLYIKYSPQEGEVDERSVQIRYENWRELSETAKQSFDKLNAMVEMEFKEYE